MFLEIANKYNYSAINQDLRDELLGTRKPCDDDYYILLLYAYIGYSNYMSSLKKYNAFKYHMKLALQAIFYGDRELLKKHAKLASSPIYIKFDSSIPMFNNYEFYGYVKDYIR